MRKFAVTKLNICVPVLHQILTAVCGLIIARIILQSFGSENNGLMQSVSQLLGYTVLLEGGIGGVIGAGLLGFLYATIFKDNLIIDNANIVFPIVCAIAAIISQIGDLCASGIKRDHDIKDYSKLIPGHGGILDRFDSVIITAPIIFYLILYIDKIL